MNIVTVANSARMRKTAAIDWSGISSGIGNAVNKAKDWANANPELAGAITGGTVLSALGALIAGKGRRLKGAIGGGLTGAVAGFGGGRLYRNYANTKTQLATEQANNETLRAANKDMRSSISGLRNDLSVRDATIAGLQGTVKQITEEKNKIQAAYDNGQIDLASARKRLDELNAAHSDALKELQDMTAHYNVASTELSNTRSQHQAAQDTITKLTQENTELKNRPLQKERDTLQQKLKELTGKGYVIKGRKEEYAERQKQIQAQNDQRVAAERHQAMEAQRAKIREAQEQLKALQAELKGM